MIPLSVLVFGVFAVLTAWAGSLNELLVYRFLTGIGLGGAMPNIIALTSEYAPARMRAMLIAVMFCGFPLGSTLGGVVSAPLLGAFGWQSVFVLGGVLPLLTPVALVFPGRDIVRGDAPALRPCDGRHGDHGSTAQRPLTPWA